MNVKMWFDYPGWRKGKRFDLENQPDASCYVQVRSPKRARRGHQNAMSNTGARTHARTHAETRQREEVTDSARWRRQTGRTGRIHLEGKAFAWIQRSAAQMPHSSIIMPLITSLNK